MDFCDFTQAFPESGKHFSLKTITRSRESLCIEAKSRKNVIFATLQTLPESEKRFFSLRKYQIRIPSMFLPLEESFHEKIFKNFFTWVPPMV